MKKKNGFTLIELLAVIIILGVIMLIAIPSVTKYINDSRKDTYIDTAKQLVKGAIPMVNSGVLDMYDTNTTYYIPASCIPTENTMSSPFGEFTEAYVIVGYTGEGYEYYWASVDEAHQGIEMKDYNNLTKSDVKSNVESIDTTLGIGSRTNIMVLNEESCQTFEQSEGYDPTAGIVVYPEGKNRSTVVAGDPVSIGLEEFYVVKHDGNKLLLLTKYDLDKITHEQHKENNASNTDVIFSSQNYWDGQVGSNLKYKGNYCLNQTDTECAYIYDENCNAYELINSYISILSSTYNINNISGRLMSLEEAYELKSTNSNGIEIIKDKNNTVYWLGTTSISGAIWNANWNGEIHGERYFTNYFASAGIRPIIII